MQWSQETWVHSRLPPLYSGPEALGKSRTPPRLRLLNDTTGILSLGPLRGRYGEVLGRTHENN